jgi:uncharacterized membrane protein YdjX (TVP38/TMEM64 family)
MVMGTRMLFICLALAAAGQILLGLTLGASIRTARTPRRPMRCVVLALAGVLTAGLLWVDIVVIWCLVEYGLWAVDFSSQGLRTLIDNAGAWAPAASIGLMAAHSFVPFPAEIIAVANGIAFGPWLGVLLTWSGAMLGAILSYEMTRALGPAARSRLIPARYRGRADTFALNVGIAPLLIARLLPIMSFNLINYAAGLAGVPRGRFIWTTALGILPLTVLSVLLGSQGVRLPAYVWILVGLAVLIFLGIGVARRLSPTYRHTGASKPNTSGLPRS